MYRRCLGRPVEDSYPNILNSAGVVGIIPARNYLRRVSLFSQLMHGHLEQIITPWANSIVFQSHWSS